MKKITISSLFLFVLVMSSVSAVTMGLSGTVLNSSSENADGNLTVSIYEVATGGSAIYSENFTITNGSYNVMLGVGVALDLVYGNTYYLDLLVNGDDMDFNGTDRQQFVSNVGNVSGDGTGGWINNSANTSTSLNVSIDGALFVDGNNVSTTALIVNGSINISDVGGKLYVPRICLDGDCRSVWSNGTYNAVNGAYLYALSSTIYFNETKLNATITALSASDTQKNASGYLYNDSTTIYLNETLLNATIDARHDGTGGWVNDSANTSTNLNVVINNSLNVAGQVTLNDLLQLNATTTPGTCNGTVEGAIFYNATSNMPCYCNGTAWNLFNGSAC